jgi:hypothetical protein
MRSIRRRRASPGSRWSALRRPTRKPPFPPQQRFDPRQRRRRPLRAIAFSARRRARPAAAGFPNQRHSGSGRQRAVLCRGRAGSRRGRPADQESARRSVARARLRGLGARARQLGLALGQQQCGANQRLDRRRDLRRRCHLQSHVASRLRRRLQPVQFQFHEYSGVWLQRLLSLCHLRRLAGRALGFARGRQRLLERPQHVATGHGSQSRGRPERQLCRQDVARLRRGRPQFRFWPGRFGALRQCLSAGT